MRKRDPFLKMLRRLQGSAKALRTTVAGKPKWEIAITREDLEAQFNAQQGRCYWLGVKLNPDDVFKTNSALIPSIDRLDTSKGYVVGNFVICTRFANLGRGCLPAEAFGPQIKAIRKAMVNEMWPKFLFETPLTVSTQNPTLETQ